jgi:hypothetical protein
VKRLILICLAASAAAWAAGKPAASPAPKPAPSAKVAPHVGVDWQGQVLTATGSGAPDLRATTPAQARLGAETAAKLDAFRNLLAQAKGVQLESGKTLGDALGDDATRGHVQGALRGFKVTHKRYFSDNGVEIDVEVPLAGVLAALPATGDAVAVNEQGEATSTGLVVDARGLKVTPALAPRLLGPDGKAVYSRAVVKDEKATVAGYYATLAAAKASDRVGSHPLTVKATGVKGADLLLSAEDAKAIEAHNSAYLAAGKVAIVAEGVGR